MRRVLLLAGVLLLLAAAKPTVVEDDIVRYELPPAWTATGESGEYWLDAEQEVGSLLLLPPDPEMPLEVRLAEIEEQFLSTGVIDRETSEIRRMDGDPVHVRRYRLTMAGSDTAPVVIHQYSFVRSAVRVLLQVETAPEGGHAEELFETIYRSLEVLRAPDPFDVEMEPGFEDEEAIEDSSALFEAFDEESTFFEDDSAAIFLEGDDFEAIVDSSDATIQEPGEPDGK
jgi:hypothetical protein